MVKRSESSTPWICPRGTSWLAISGRQRLGELVPVS
jgi:hypothetical protein